jgi:GNAT superfamily N-acetyltransferase
METLNTVRPLAENDDRASFDCGRASLNGWFQRNAWRNQMTGVSRTYVLPDPTQPQQIKGYVTLAAGEIRREFLPKSQQRNMPDPMPIVLLGQLAVDVAHQGTGVSKVLLAATFTFAVHVSKTIGSFALVTHPLDDNARAFYQRWGFSTLEPDPQQAMYIRIRDLEASGVQ